MEGPSNGGLLYHEVQEAKLCAVHCVNTALQGPFFSELDLAALASDLDHKERQMLIDDAAGLRSGDFLSEDSHNVSMGGDFSIQVLQKALEVWDLQVIPLDSPAADPSKYNPETENAFICHLHNHWFCIRKVNGEWYNFNSLYPAPEHLSKFYLSAFLDTLKGCGWSIFLVRGNFPKECPITSEASSFGQWLTPEDAERITKSCNQGQVPTASPQAVQFIDDDAIEDQEEQDLNAAIAASLMDSYVFGAGADGGNAMESTTSQVQADAAENRGSSIDSETVGAESGEGEVKRDESDSTSAVSETYNMSKHDKNH